MPTIGDRIAGLRKKKWVQALLMLILFSGLTFLFVECRKAMD
jgi:hypothetical protein